MTDRQKAEFLAGAAPTETRLNTATRTRPSIGAHVCAILSPRMPQLFPPDSVGPLSPRLTELLKELKRLDNAE